MPAVEKLITDNLDVWSSAIKVKSSAGRGAGKKMELYGIRKLRELILELAVRGLLVPQDAGDEPASELLKKIKEEKEKLVEEGKIKKQKVLPPVGDDKKPFGLPDGWVWTQLDQITEIAPRNNLDDELEVGFVPMPMVSTSYKGDHEQEVRKWTEIKKGYTHFADGDIALAKITPCFENSKAAVFRNLKNGYGAGTTELHIARPISETVDPLFILLYLKAPMFLEKGKTKMTGSAGQKRVPNNFFSCNPLPLPPFEEQHRIVAKVDELMALCNQLEQQTETSISAHQTLVQSLLEALIDASKRDGINQAWTRIAEHFDTLFTTEWSIDQLKQTILQLAVMGKLVPQIPNDEPASELLDRLKLEKERLIKTNKIKRQKKFSPIDEKDKQIEIPNGWALTQIGFLGDASESSIVDGPFGSSISTQKDYIDSGVPVTRMSNISPFIYKYDNLKYVSQTKLSELQRHNILSGDVLLGKVGSIGNAVIYPDDMPEGLIATTGVARYRVGKVITKEYMCNLLNALGPKLRSIASQAVQPFLNMKTINSCAVILPPIEEQHRIVAKVDELMTLCDTLKSHLNTVQTTQFKLADTLAEQAIG